MIFAALTITLPIWVIIIIGCSIGYIVTAMAIGPEKPKTGVYGFDLVTPALHVLAILGWIIVTLILLLIFK